MSINFDQRYIDFNLARDYPPAPPEEQPEEMPMMEDVQLAAGPSGTVSDAGAAFGVFPQMKPRRGGRSDIGERVITGAPDFAAGTARGAATAALGFGGDIQKIGRFISALATDNQGGSIGDRLGRAAQTMENPTLLPSSEDVSKGGYTIPGTSITLPGLPPAVPAGQAGFGMTPEQRQSAAEAGQFTGELVGDPLILSSVAKGAVKAAKPVVQMIGKSLTSKGAKLTPNIEVPAAGDITKPAFKNWFGDSKVTNDAGQPIVVYHARAGDFDSFDTAGRGKTKGTGAFFSSSADVASTYGVKGEENIAPVYLSMKKPVIIDANGANWSDIDMSAKISVPEIKVSDIEEQKLMAELTGSAVDEAAMKTIPAAEMSLGDLKINNKVIDKKVNTDEIARWARKMGYDGVIIKNVIDSGPSGRYMPDEAMNPQNVYVAFEPTQIKSVFNKGTWNPDDPRMVQGAGAATAGTGAATMSDKEQK
jgi:hypothetical protein